MTEDNSNSNGTLEQADWDFPFEQRLIADAKKEFYPIRFRQLDKTYGKKLAKIIYDAKGVFYNNSSDVKNVFEKKIKDKVQVSNLSKIFFDEYNGKDLWEYAADIIGGETLNNLVKYKPKITKI